MKLAVFDCDSTLSRIEGVDELARVSDPEIFARVEEMTNQAMGGDVPIDEVFGRRLDLIQPTEKMCREIGQQYITEMIPGVAEVCEKLKKSGWTLIIISGGFTQVIEPLAEALGVAEAHAVSLVFDADGNYLDFDRDAPTARNGGKPEIIQMLKNKHAPSSIFMVGDGVSDLETKPLVDRFIGFGAVIPRKKVKEGADFFTESFLDIFDLVADL